MANIDDGELKRSLEVSERRLAESRQRRVVQRRRTLVLAALAVVVIPLGIVVGLTQSKAPEAPLLVLTWPKPKIKQTLLSGQRVVFRRGQPFDLTVTQPQNWNVDWRSPESESRGPDFPWQPANNNARLEADCHPIPTGWTRYFAYLWPTRRVSIQAVMPQKTGNYTRSLELGEQGAWLNPLTYAEGNISWDERALQMLLIAVPKLPQTKLNSALAETRTSPSPALWKVVSDFEGNSKAPSVDGATYAVLYAPDLENLMPRIARGMLKEAPQASLKFVVRLDRQPQQGIVRIAFDGKQERRAWIRRQGETTGGPLLNWETEEATPEAGLPPSLPR